MGRRVITIARGGRGRKSGRSCTERGAIRGGVETNWTTARVGWAGAVREAPGDDAAPTVMARAWVVGDGRARFVFHPLLLRVFGKAVKTGTDKTVQKSRKDRAPRERSPPLRRKSRTPPAPVKEEPAVHSGSEEGEMVEEG